MIQTHVQPAQSATAHLGEAGASQRPMGSTWAFDGACAKSIVLGEGAAP